MKKGILILATMMSFALSACSSGVGVDSDCNIKGNVSYNTGEQIYHLPEDQFYEVTKIDERYGEEWFCSVEEAEEAGFRRTLR